MDIYRDEHNLEPTFIYRRFPGDYGMAYVPAMQIMLNPDDVVVQSSKEWCAIVLKEMLRTSDMIVEPADERRADDDD